MLTSKTQKKKPYRLLVVDKIVKKSYNYKNNNQTLISECILNTFTFIHLSDALNRIDIHDNKWNKSVF